MHSTEREKLILESLDPTGFISFQELERRVAASPATIRRDLERMMGSGLLVRVRGGAKRTQRGKAATEPDAAMTGLAGVPFRENVQLHRRQKQAIGRAAAKLCSSHEGIMIDGGSTTLQMCQHLAALNLQVLTNSLHIVNALLPQTGTRLLIPGGQLFREQNIVLGAAADQGMPRFHAPKLFMGAASIGPAGLMQADIILVEAERRLIDRADEIIVLVDSSKFSGPSGHVVCPLEEIDTVVTDSGISPARVGMLEKARIRVIIADE